MGVEYMAVGDAAAGAGAAVGAVAVAAVEDVVVVAAVNPFQTRYSGLGRRIFH